MAIIRLLCRSSITGPLFALSLLHPEDQSKDLDGYKDSAIQRKRCKDGINESNYNKAIDLMNSGNYQKAIRAFTDIIYYKDSEKMIKECRYQKANEDVLNGNNHRLRK